MFLHPVFLWIFLDRALSCISIKEHVLIDQGLAKVSHIGLYLYAFPPLTNNS